MIACAVGVVMEEIPQPNEHIQWLKVRMMDGSKARAILYPDTLRRALPGDRVLMNTTAVQLKLGTGGAHIVISYMDEEDQGVDYERQDHAGHLMKLRYTPLQRAILAVEEPDSPYHDIFLQPQSLLQMPVIIGELHSMLPIATAWLRYRQSDANLRIAYIMTDGGALPLNYSQSVSQLKQSEMIDHTITYGHAYGGDFEALNKYTALIAAKHIANANITIVTMGPGIAGTGTLLGNTGVETAEIVQAVYQLGGRPVLIPRVSFADERERHYGISHHCLSVYKYLLREQIDVPFPDSLTEGQLRYISEQLHTIQHAKMTFHNVQTKQVQEALGMLSFSVTTMGRSFEEDPAYFLTVAAAAEQAWTLMNP